MSSLLFQAQADEKLELAVSAAKSEGKWVATIAGKVPAANGAVLDVTIRGRREHLAKEALVPVAWENPIRRKTKVTGGAIKLRQEFDRAGVFAVEIAVGEKVLSTTIRVGSPEVTIAEAAAQVKKTEDLLDLADKALEKFEKAAKEKDRAKSIVKPFDEVRDAEAKLSEYAASTYHAAAVDETIAALHEAILFGSWVMNVEGKSDGHGGNADADSAGGANPKDKSKDVGKISVAGLRERVKAARGVIARETALWAAGEFRAALEVWPDDLKALESVAKGFKSAREKLGADFLKDLDPSKLTADTFAESKKAAEAAESSLRK